MPKRRTDDLVGKRRQFAELMVRGKSKSAAFEEAVGDKGGTDNAGHKLTADRLLEDPSVRDHIIGRLGKYGVSMQLLGNKLLSIVDDIADKYKNGEVDEREALVCVKVGLDFIVKCDGADLFKKADDKAKELMSRADAARAIVGADPKNQQITVEAQVVKGTETEQ